MKKKLLILILIFTISFFSPVLNNIVPKTSAYISYFPGGSHCDLIFAAVNSFIMNSTDSSFLECKNEIFSLSNDYYDQMCLAQEDYDSEYYRQWGHYWNPITKQGLYGNAGAPYHAQTYFERAVSYYLGLGIYPVDKSEAYYALGHTLHLVQDVTVPHHTHLDPFGRHSDYEYFCDLRIKDGNIDLPLYGKYLAQKDWDGNITIKGWVHQAALHAYPYYSIIEYSEYDYNLWLDIANFLMGKAMELSAGIIYYFWQYVNDFDNDHDGLGTRDEYKFKSDPILYDTDFDSIGDFEEVISGVDGFVTHPGKTDTDADYLSDPEEIDIYLTNPTVNDTDKDSFIDGVEVDLGTNPLDPNDHPPFPTENTPTKQVTGYKKLIPIVSIFSIILAVIIVRKKINRFDG